MVFDFNIAHDYHVQAEHRPPQYIASRAGHPPPKKDKEEIKEEAENHKEEAEKKKEDVIANIKTGNYHFKASAIQDIKQDFENASLVTLGAAIIMGGYVAIYKNKDKINFESISPEISVINGNEQYILKTTFSY